MRLSRSSSCSDSVAAQQPQERFERLHVFVISLIGGEALVRCLAALTSQGASVTVLGSQRPSDLDSMQDSPSAAAWSVPERRLNGLESGQTSLIGFIEDTCLPGPRWCEAVCESLSQPKVVAVGGPVEVCTALPPKFRALALTEYASFSSSQFRSSKQVDSLPGANFAVKANAVLNLGSWPYGLVDNELFARVIASGGLMSAQANAFVTYSYAYRDGARLLTRFHHGRIYGGNFGRGRSLLGRISAAFATAAAPCLLTVRTLSRSPRWVWRSPQTLGWIFLMHLAWSAGEILGKATGHTGASVRKWV